MPTKNQDASQDDVVHVGFTLKGKLAEAFEEMFFEAYKAKEVRSKADFARSLVVAQMQNLGANVEDTMGSWGGYRVREDDDELGQFSGITAAQAA